MLFNNGNVVSRCFFFGDVKSMDFGITSEGIKSFPFMTFVRQVIIINYHVSWKSELCFLRACKDIRHCSG